MVNTACVFIQNEIKGECWCSIFSLIIYNQTDNGGTKGEYFTKMNAKNKWDAPSSGQNGKTHNKLVRFMYD
jgi:hypothetical protein